MDFGPTNGSADSNASGGVFLRYGNPNWRNFYDFPYDFVTHKYYYIMEAER